MPSGDGLRSWDRRSAYSAADGLSGTASGDGLRSRDRRSVDRTADGLNGTASGDYGRHRLDRSVDRTVVVDIGAADVVDDLVLAEVEVRSGCDE